MPTCTTTPRICKSELPIIPSRIVVQSPPAGGTAGLFKMVGAMGVRCDTDAIDFGAVRTKRWMVPWFPAGGTTEAKWAVPLVEVVPDATDRCISFTVHGAQPQVLLQKPPSIMNELLHFPHSFWGETSTNTQDYMVQMLLIHKVLLTSIYKCCSCFRPRRFTPSCESKIIF